MINLQPLWLAIVSLKQKIMEDLILTDIDSKDSIIFNTLRLERIDVFQSWKDNILT